MNGVMELDRREVLRRLPPLKELNDSLQEETIEVFRAGCPSSFWKREASSSGKYHPADTTGKKGLWLHTLRVESVFNRIAQSRQEGGHLSTEETGQGITACLLHDILKYGKPGNRRRHTVKNHDRLAFNYLKETFDLPEPVLNAVDTHNGPWGSGATPSTPLQEAVHLADMMASHKNTHIALEDPPEEILDTSQIVTPDSLHKRGGIKR